MDDFERFWLGLFKTAGYLGKLPLLQQRCCGDIMASDGWDRTGVYTVPSSCLLDGAHCPFFSRTSITPVPIAARNAPIEANEVSRIELVRVVLRLLLFLIGGYVVLTLCSRAMPWLLRVLGGFLQFPKALFPFNAGSNPSAAIGGVASIITSQKKNSATYKRKSPATTPKKKSSSLRERLQEMQLLVHGLRLQGSCLRNVMGDGNCLFRAVSYQFSGTEDGHAELRARAIDQLRAHRDDYEPFVLEEDGPYDPYVAKMAKNGTYGTQIEIAALTRALGRRIRVFRANLEAGTVTHQSHDAHKGTPASSEGQIDIAFFAWSKHYYVVLPAGGVEATGDGKSVLRDGEASPVKGTGTAPMTELPSRGTSFESAEAAAAAVAAAAAAVAATTTGAAPGVAPAAVPAGGAAGAAAAVSAVEGVVRAETPPRERSASLP